MDSLRGNLARDLKPYYGYIPKINKPTLRSILKLYVAFMEQQKCSKDAYDRESAKIASTNEISQEDYAIMFSCITILMESFLRLKNANLSELKDSLKELKFNEDCINDLTKVMHTNHQSLVDQLQEMRLLKPIDRLQARINISLVENGLNPTVILHLEYKGKIQTINLSLKQFHKFRLAVSNILSEVHQIEGKKG